MDTPPRLARESVVLPLPLVILRVREHMADVDLAAVEVDHDGYAELVPPHVEHNELADLVGAPVGGPHVGEVLPLRQFGHPPPILQGPAGVRMNLPELTQLL